MANRINSGFNSNELPSYDEACNNPVPIISTLNNRLNYDLDVTNQLYRKYFESNILINLDKLNTKENRTVREEIMKTDCNHLYKLIYVVTINDFLQLYDIANTTNNLYHIFRSQSLWKRIIYKHSLKHYNYNIPYLIEYYLNEMNMTVKHKFPNYNKNLKQLIENGNYLTKLVKRYRNMLIEDGLIFS